jgi:very-short-patch-repair endonuclease
MAMTEVNLKERARQLRKDMTEAEHHLWSKIRFKQLGNYLFYRQKIIGNYIADFYCHKAKLVIEVDGSQHYNNEGSGNDRQRDAYLRSCGITIIRFSNIEVLQNTTGVVERIAEELRKTGESTQIPL